MGLVDDIVHSIGRCVRMDARRLLLPILLVLAGGLTGAAGIAFLTVWAYLSLSLAIGHGRASLLIGLGLTILAAGLLVLARKRFLQKPPADPLAIRPMTDATGKAVFASQVAFTAAFVLARYLDHGRRD